MELETGSYLKAFFQGISSQGGSFEITRSCPISWFGKWGIPSGSRIPVDHYEGVLDLDSL